MIAIIDRGLNGLYLFCAFLSAVCLLLICPMILANIVGRWIGVFVPGTNEIGGYLMAGAGTLGFAYTFGVNGHIRVSMLTSKLSEPVRWWVDLAGLAIAAGLMCFLAWYAVDMLILTHEYDDRSSGTDNMLLWIAQTPMVIGLVVFAVSLVHGLVAALVAGRAIYPEREVL
jgi:TRAP-type C4-dicarboxylate transport system permease small subunit